MPLPSSPHCSPTITVAGIQAAVSENPLARPARRRRRASKGASALEVRERPAEPGNAELAEHRERPTKKPLSLVLWDLDRPLPSCPAYGSAVHQWASHGTADAPFTRDRLTSWFAGSPRCGRGRPEYSSRLRAGTGLPTRAGRSEGLVHGLSTSGTSVASTGVPPACPCGEGSPVTFGGDAPARGPGARGSGRDRDSALRCAGYAGVVDRRRRPIHPRRPRRRRHRCLAHRPAGRHPFPLPIRAARQGRRAHRGRRLHDPGEPRAVPGSRRASRPPSTTSRARWPTRTTGRRSIA